MNLFLDMDRVLVDIDRGYRGYTGLDGTKLSPKEWWANVEQHPAFFQHLPPSPDLAEIRGLAKSLRYHYGIVPFALSACPPQTDRFLSVAKQKRLWLDAFYPELPLLPSMGSKTKPAFLQNVGDILVDDLEDTLHSWELAGGKGFLYNCKDADFSRVKKEIHAYLKTA